MSLDSLHIFTAVLLFVMMVHVLSNAQLSYPYSFDCAMRQLALEYAQKIQPFLSRDQLQEVADALNGAPEKSQNCTVTLHDLHTIPKLKTRKPHSRNSNNIDCTIFVDYNFGNDNNNGTIDYPIQHLHHAIQLFASNAINSNSNSNSGCTETIVKKHIILREGIHYLENTINITSNIRNLIISNLNNEKVQLSGGIKLNCNNNWQPTSISPLIYKCNVSIANMDMGTIREINGLRVNSTRGIRARYPNGNPEYFPCGFCSNISAKSWIKSNCSTVPRIEIKPNIPYRNDTENNLFEYYQMGVGSNNTNTSNYNNNYDVNYRYNYKYCCDVFEPNYGYWCGNNVQGGGAAPYTYSGGLEFDNNILPNSKYYNSNNLKNGMIHSFNGGLWSTWMFEINNQMFSRNRNRNSNSSTIYFKKGGFQDARGGTNGGKFFIDNVFVELDHPNEYYFNQTSQVLYYYLNITDNNKTYINQTLIH